jgi:acyl-coenzyme A thioesterase PaaI-like protein
VLADYAGVSAVACTLPAGWFAATTGFQVHNVAPAVGERLLAIGRAQHVGRTVAVSRAEVYAVTGDVATLVCVAMTTCRPFEISRV